MAQYTRFQKRLFANIDRNPETTNLQQRGMVQREGYMKGQQKQKDMRGFGMVKPGAYPKPDSNKPLERMYQERQSRFGRNVKRNRFTGSEQSTQQQVKYTQGTNALVRKQLERGEISQEAFANRYSFMPNTYSVARARGRVKR